jgi:hypothetical protein
MLGAVAAPRGVTYKYQLMPLDGRAGRWKKLGSYGSYAMVEPELDNNKTSLLKLLIYVRK